MPLRSEIELRDLKRLFLSPKPAILLAYCVGVYPALSGVVGMPEQLEGGPRSVGFVGYLGGWHCGLNPTVGTVGYVGFFGPFFS